MAHCEFACPEKMYSMIDSSLIEVLLKHEQKGDRLMFVRSHNGQIKVNIKYGPLKCLEKRYLTNNATFKEIKQAIAV